jgi:hydrogenase maturation protease
MKKVLVGGIGNVLLGDDGVGPYAVRLLNSQYAFEGGVEVIDLGTPALDLIDQFSGKDAVILIDCIQCDDADPGSVQLYRKDDLIRYRPEVRMDPHSPALVENLLSADLFGLSPRELLLVGIVGENYEPGCSLSPKVDAAIPKVFREILHELDRVGVKYQRREKAIDPQIWWSSQDQRSELVNLLSRVEIIPTY